MALATIEAPSAIIAEVDPLDVAIAQYQPPFVLKKVDFPRNRVDNLARIVFNEPGLVIPSVLSDGTRDEQGRVNVIGAKVLVNGRMEEVFVNHEGDLEVVERLASAFYIIRDWHLTRGISPSNLRDITEYLIKSDGLFP